MLSPLLTCYLHAGPTDLSTLMAQRLKMEAVHSNTSIVISPSHTPMSRDHSPPWNYTKIRTRTNTRTHTHTHTHARSVVSC